MEETTTLLLTLTLLFLLPTTTTTQQPPPEPLLSAASQILTDTGYLSMALTLHLTSSSLHLPSPSTTIFVPSNTAFLRHGPLPLSLLKYHILPTRLPLQYLSSLPSLTPLPTLQPNSSLFLTTSLSSHQFSLNDVVVVNTPIFDDGFLLMLLINDFFNSSSLLLPVKETFPSVFGFLKFNGFSIFANFLESQFSNEAKLTIFAPLDEVVVESVRNVTCYSAIFRKHIVPRLIMWRDLIRLPDETLLPTLSEGFVIRVNVAPRIRFFNGVTVAFPNIYRSSDIVVHGIDGLLDRNSM
ncbi:hypothetical protein Lal_00044698 [Lupinus albus]|uniref:Putative FAS1 domain-containing protein n=1 Tax=Lupinus albus TaxID=3870 RepID=A0A6A5LH79_LUPAL|nr:putative FAS1 domain-containing protein [Lupinus albus]KAF1858665.1 hypothetical protein Lal_00044698 [Lupinus albus]